MDKQVENTADASATAERRFDWNGRSQGKDVALEEAKEAFKVNQEFEQTLRESGFEVTYTQNRSESAVVQLSTLGVVPSIGNVATELINATRNTLSGAKNLGAAVKGFSKNGVNRLNNLIKTGKSPKSVQRADKGRIFGEKDHVHFSDGSALNADGTWKHGGRSLSNSETKFLKENGWTLPL